MDDLRFEGLHVAVFGESGPSAYIEKYFILCYDNDNDNDNDNILFDNNIQIYTTDFQ